MVTDGLIVDEVAYAKSYDRLQEHQRSIDQTMAIILPSVRVVDPEQERVYDQPDNAKRQVHYQCLCCEFRPVMVDALGKLVLSKR